MHQSPLDLLKLRRVEVLHVGWGEEDGHLAWFWPRAGSGTFINLDALRSRGNILQIESRSDIKPRFPDEWASGGAGLHAFMLAKNMSGLHIQNTRGPPTDPYPGLGELIVRTDLIGKVDRGQRGEDSVLAHWRMPFSRLDFRRLFPARATQWAL